MIWVLLSRSLAGACSPGDGAVDSADAVVGDSNGDGLVNSADTGVVGDTNGDGVVNGADTGLAGDNNGESGAPKFTSQSPVLVSNGACRRRLLCACLISDRRGSQGHGNDDAHKIAGRSTPQARRDACRHARDHARLHLTKPRKAVELCHLLSKTPNNEEHR